MKNPNQENKMYYEKNYNDFQSKYDYDRVEGQVNQTKRD